MKRKIEIGKLSSSFFILYDSCTFYFIKIIYLFIHIYQYLFIHKCFINFDPRINPFLFRCVSSGSGGVSAGIDWGAVSFEGCEIAEVY